MQERTDMMYGLLGLMASRGVTSRKLADVLGVSENTLTGYIHRRRSMSTDQVARLCRYFGLSDPAQICEIFLEN